MFRRIQTQSVLLFDIFDAFKADIVNRIIDRIEPDQCISADELKQLRQEIEEFAKKAFLKQVFKNIHKQDKTLHNFLFICHEDVVDFFLQQNFI